MCAGAVGVQLVVSLHVSGLSLHMKWCFYVSCAAEAGFPRQAEGHIV